MQDVSGFKDHFSNQAADYGRYRPGYPDALFAYLAARAPGRRLAWDCATGSGQAARSLARHFRQVLATDASAAQLAHAHGPDNVHFAVAAAERTDLAAGSVDLITVAQALHWLDLQRFYAEARRVLRPGGVLAAWCYGLFSSSEPRIDRIIETFYGETVGPYWPPERRLIEAGYRTLPFPFAPVPAPQFGMRLELSLEGLLGYLGTWSAVQRYVADRGEDPLQTLAPQLRRVWPNREAITVQWTLRLLLGRVDASA